MKDKAIPFDFFILYEQKLIILLETDCGSNKYNQVILNEEQFKKVSNTISNCFEIKKINEEFEEIGIKLSEEEYTLPEHINSINN